MGFSATIDPWRDEDYWPCATTPLEDSRIARDAEDGAPEVSWDFEPEVLAAEVATYLEFWDEAATRTCPLCYGPGVHLGTLGYREHYRCRNCGADFSRKERT